MYLKFVTVKILLIIPSILVLIKSCKWPSEAERQSLITKERCWWQDLIWGEGKRERKEIGVWHLPAPHLPEQLLLIVYPHLPRDKNELEREEESSLSQSSQPRGEICGTCCTLTPGWLHSLVASLISWMRREGEKIKSVIERERGERKCAKIIFF